MLTKEMKISIKMNIAWILGVICTMQMQCVMARTSQRTLLDVNDRLYVYGSTDGQTSLVDQVELRQFPYIMAVSTERLFVNRFANGFISVCQYTHNTTLEGCLCYAIDIDAFERDCFMSEDPETTKWVSQIVQ